MGLLLMILLVALMATTYYGLVVAAGLKAQKYRLAELFQWRQLLKKPTTSKQPLLWFQVALLVLILSLLIIYLIN